MIKIGIDIHEVADTAPHFFSELSKILVEKGHEVHILTGAEKTDQLIDYIKNKLEISFTHLFSITTWHKENGAKIIYIDGNPYMESKSWNRCKAEYCEKKGIHLHLDDSDIYGKYFTTPYARFYGNTPVAQLRIKSSAGGSDLLDDLSNYDDSKYKKPSVTVDIAICTIIDNTLKVLLIKRKYPPYRSHWALPGGFLEVEADETLEQTAKRELEEETSLTDIPVHQLKTYGDPGRDPRTRIITTVFYSLIPYNMLKDKKIKAGDDAADTQWFPLKNIDNSDSLIAFDHKKILNDIISKIKQDAKISPIAFNLTGKTFEWNELKNIYQIILDQSIDMDRFKKTINSNFMIEQDADDKLVFTGVKDLF